MQDICMMFSWVDSHRFCAQRLCASCRTQQKSPRYLVVPTVVETMTLHTMTSIALHSLWPGIIPITPQSLGHWLVWQLAVMPYSEGCVFCPHVGKERFSRLQVRLTCVSPCLSTIKVNIVWCFRELINCHGWSGSLCRQVISINSIDYSRYIDGLVQDCSISSALALEILQSCTTPST